MDQRQTIVPIAHMQSAFTTKFGIPRQSNLVPSLESTIVFTPEFRQADALRGLSDFSYIWLIWGFSESPEGQWTTTVRPPRLGGNERKGVFATRSPFRPNGLGLSSVRIEAVEINTPSGPVIHVSGADLLDGTPIYDIKPYIPSDCHQDAVCGFASEAVSHVLQVHIPREIAQIYAAPFLSQLTELLALDPRPAYHDDCKRTYGLSFDGYEVKFTVKERDLFVISIGK